MLFDDLIFRPTQNQRADGKFDVIYADPPWSYNGRVSHENRSTKFGSGASGHYDVMSDAELLALPVPTIAADDAVLFMWATWPRLDFALQLITAWGFSYKTCAFDWFKTNPNGGLFFGVGYYSKSNSEPCLLATRGNILKPATNSVSMAVEDFDWEEWKPEAIKAQRREHSRKPDEVRRRIELLYPDRARVELFARTTAKGWDAWGNQVESDITLEVETDAMQKENATL